MNKGIRLIKRMVALSLVLLLSIESFAAVVSDNDGSAFITKAEFDSLKNDFQSQIDQYNTSIDSKIDGAIASYLAGIKLSKVEEVKTVYAPTEGVMSVSANDLSWHEGLMDIKMYGTLFRYGNPNGQGCYNFSSSNSTSSSSFYETLVYDIGSTGYARFGGYQRTKQYAVLNGQSFANYGYKQGTYSSIVTGYCGIWPINNSVLTLNNSDVLLRVAFAGNSVDADLWNWNQISFYGNQGSFRREILTADSNTFYGGIILNKTSLEHKFNNNDDITDWCNDNINDGHTSAIYWNSLALSGGGNSYKINGTNTASYTSTTFNTNTTFTSDSRGEAGLRVWPYFGFANQVGNWNKIYDGNLDLHYDEILLDIDFNKNKNTIFNKGSNHIKIGAGLPVVIVNENDKVTYEFNFANKTIDYAVWVKIGSFDSTKNLEDDKDGVITNFTTSGNTEYVESWKALKIVNGTGKCTFTAEEKGVVYMKWALASGVPNDGGGILYPAKSVIVER